MGMSGEEALGAARKYVKETMAGAGAVKGQDGKDGIDGKSAYEIAKEHGFDGTESEWLESIKGVDGKSAYEIALDEGFVGTEEEWLESIKGSTNSDSISNGNPVILTDLQGGVPFSEIAVKGENIAGQEMTLTATGKNQLPITVTNGTGAGVTYTVSKDEITVSGTTTGVTTIVVSAPNMTITKDMRLSYRGNLSGITPKATILRNGETLYPTPNSTVGSKLLAGDVLQNVYIQQQNADVVVSGSAKFQLEYGTEVTEYEKYSSETYTFTPDDTDYIIPSNVVQKEDINVLSVNAEGVTLSVTGVVKNAAVAKLWTEFTESADTVDDVNMNYIDNSNFRVNTRGQAEYTANGSSIYTVDRWYIDGGTLTPVENGVQFKNPNTQAGSSSLIRLKQDIPYTFMDFAGKNVTLSAKINGTVYTKSAIIPTEKPTTGNAVQYIAIGIPEFGLNLNYVVNGDYFVPYFALAYNQTIVVEWMKLEVSDKLTSYVEPDYQTEKMKTSFMNDNGKMSLPYTKDEADSLFVTKENATSTVNVKTGKFAFRNGYPDEKGINIGPCASGYTLLDNVLYSADRNAFYAIDLSTDTPTMVDNFNVYYFNLLNTNGEISSFCVQRDTNGFLWYFFIVKHNDRVCFYTYRCETGSLSGDYEAKGRSPLAVNNAQDVSDGSYLLLVDGYVYLIYPNEMEQRTIIKTNNPKYIGGSSDIGRVEQVNPVGNTLQYGIDVWSSDKFIFYINPNELESTVNIWDTQLDEIFIPKIYDRDMMEFMDFSLMFVTYFKAAKCFIGYNDRGEYYFHPYYGPELLLSNWNEVNSRISVDYANHPKCLIPTENYLFVFSGDFMTTPFVCDKNFNYTDLNNLQPDVILELNDGILIASTNGAGRVLLFEKKEMTIEDVINKLI